MPQARDAGRQAVGKAGQAAVALYAKRLVRSRRPQGCALCRVSCGKNLVLGGGCAAAGHCPVPHLPCWREWCFASFQQRKRRIQSQWQGPRAFGLCDVPCLPCDAAGPFGSAAPSAVRAGRADGDWLFRPVSYMAFTLDQLIWASKLAAGEARMNSPEGQWPPWQGRSARC